MSNEQKAFEDHFSTHSRQYAQARPTYPDEIYAYLASLAPARSLAWDCGTGNGQAAIGLASRYPGLRRASSFAPSLLGEKRFGLAETLKTGLVVSTRILWARVVTLLPATSTTSSSKE